MTTLRGLLSNRSVQVTKLVQNRSKARQRDSGLILADRACGMCKLCEKCLSPKMEVSGDGGSGVLICGEAPGMREDEQGRQFVAEGMSGGKLRDALSELGFDFDRDFWATNAVNCRPSTLAGENRNPTSQELSYCRPMLFNLMAEKKPRAVLLFGSKAVESYLMDRSAKIRSSFKMDAWRGLAFPDIQRQTWVYPLLHPAFICYSPHFEHVFKRDLENALTMIGEQKEVRSVNWTEAVLPLYSPDRIVAALSAIYSGRMGDIIAIDYETTSLKPFHEGSQLVSVSVGMWNNNKPLAISFPLASQLTRAVGIADPDRASILSMLRKVLESRIGKIAHNLQMEESWSREKLGVPVNNWMWDSMQTAHILDERNKYTSLDKQVFLNWGYEYGESVGPYKEGHPINNMLSCPIDELLLYGGLDSLFTLMLQKRQERILDSEDHSDSKKANSFWLESARTFADMEAEGIYIKRDYYLQLRSSLKDEMRTIHSKLMQSPEVQRFRTEVGRPPKLSDAGANSRDLSHLLFSVMGHQRMLSDKGHIKLDAAALKDIGGEFCESILRLRNLDKLSGTYISGFLLEEKDRIHPSFNLHLVVTYRSSSSAPNFQNIPNRDGNTRQLIRKGIVAPPGYRIACADYGSHEVRIIATYFKDPVLIDEMNNDNDPHGEWVTELGLDEFKPWKEARSDCKNAFVFPEFYGSFHKPIYEDLYSRGYHISPERVEQCEKKLWDKYRVLKAGHEQLLKFYERNGYVPMLFGHRRRGCISRNKVINCAVQGSAFHCLLWSLNRANARRKAEGWESSIPGQIHDEMFCYIKVGEESVVIPAISNVMENEIRQEFPFLSVKLMAEWAITEEGGSWDTKKGIDHSTIGGSDGEITY